MLESTNNYHQFHLEAFKEHKKFIWASKASLSVINRYQGLLKQVDFIVVTEKELWGSRVGKVRIVSPHELLRVKNKNKVIVFNLVKDYYITLKGFLYKHKIYNLIPVDLLQPLLHFSQEFEEILISKPDFVKDKNTSTAIIVRGLFEPFFTKLLIKHLNLNYPNYPIILSTWEDTDKELLKDLKVDYLILNKKPENPGQGHRNYQIACVAPALKYLKEKNFEKVLIQRTDQILLRNNLIDRLDLLLKDYPTGNNLLKNRIITSDFYFRKYISYHPSDMFMYGNVNDLLLFWDVQFDKKKKEERISIFDSLKEKNIEHEDFRLPSQNEDFPEVYFFRRMLEKIGYVPKETLEDWEYLISNLFIIRNIEWWRFFWYKPETINNRIQLVREGYPLNNIDQTDWEDLFIKYCNK